MSKIGLDNFQRANYLYQLALAALRAGDLAASRQHSRQLVEFAQKAVLRLDRGLKRSLCRACHGLLVPGVTCTVRTRARPQRCQVWVCGGCQQSRRFPCPRPPGHRRVLAEAARKARLEAAGEVGEDGVVLMEGTGDSSGIGQDADVTPGPSEGTSAAGQDADVKPGPSGGAYAVSQDADMKAGPSGGASPPDQDADVTSRPSGGADADVLVTMADLPGTSAPKQ